MNDVGCWRCRYCHIAHRHITCCHKWMTICLSIRFENCVPRFSLLYITIYIIYIFHCLYGSFSVRIALCRTLDCFIYIGISKKPYVCHINPASTLYNICVSCISYRDDRKRIAFAPFIVYSKRTQLDFPFSFQYFHFWLADDGWW